MWVTHPIHSGVHLWLVLGDEVAEHPTCLHSDSSQLLACIAHASAHTSDRSVLRVYRTRVRANKKDGQVEGTLATDTVQATFSDHMDPAEMTNAY